MSIFRDTLSGGRPSRRWSLKQGPSLRLITFSIVLTLVLTAIVIVAWEQLLLPPYYSWVARNYPGPENSETRFKFEQRGEHFFISITVDLIVVSILLAEVGRQQRRLVETQERLAHNEKIATLGRVAAQVAHEVRNPLAGLLLYSLHLKGKVVARGADGEVQIVDKIIETVNRLTSTTEQILSFDRPVNFTRRLVDLNRLVRDVIELLKAQIAANRIEVSLKFSDATLMGVVDEASIGAALLNLVLNAVQAMPDGGSLTITSRADGDTLRLVVIDTGSGISREQLQTIFEPFHTTKSRGLGLGMPYAQKIIEQHGGKVQVESRVAHGTQVSIELPRGGRPA